MYDISGSAHFINKCDNGIVIHRNRDPEAGPIDIVQVCIVANIITSLILLDISYQVLNHSFMYVQVCVRKVRNKVIGTIGDAYLSYNRYDPLSVFIFL